MRLGCLGVWKNAQGRSEVEWAMATLSLLSFQGAKTILRGDYKATRPGCLGVQVQACSGGSEIGNSIGA
jgi:hypothetical protein